MMAPCCLSEVCGCHNHKAVQSNLGRELLSRTGGWDIRSSTCSNQKLVIESNEQGGIQTGTSRLRAVSCVGVPLDKPQRLL